MRSLSCFHSVARDVKSYMIINGLLSIQPFKVCDGVLEDLIGRESGKRNIFLTKTCTIQRNFAPSGSK